MSTKRYHRSYENMNYSKLLIRKKIEWINTLRPPVTQKVSIEDYDETIEMQAYEVSAFKKRDC